ncbi:MAG TPA: hypothetical protein PLT21_00405 [Syntrophales bacterium]|nr:hypothetical protein [Syntrophales bacterium]
MTMLPAAGRPLRDRTISLRKENGQAAMHDPWMDRAACLSYKKLRAFRFLPLISVSAFYTLFHEGIAGTEVVTAGADARPGGRRRFLKRLEPGKWERMKMDPVHSEAPSP